MMDPVEQEVLLATAAMGKSAIASLKRILVLTSRMDPSVAGEVANIIMEEMAEPRRRLAAALVLSGTPLKDYDLGD